MSSVGGWNLLIKQKEMRITIYIHILISTHVKTRSLASTHAIVVMHTQRSQHVPRWNKTSKCLEHHTMSSFLLPWKALKSRTHIFYMVIDMEIEIIPVSLSLCDIDIYVLLYVTFVMYRKSLNAVSFTYCTYTQPHTHTHTHTHIYLLLSFSLLMVLKLQKWVLLSMVA